MQRRLRVWRLLPPRKCLGAHSSKSTFMPARRAVMAAHSAALPPPNTKTSYIREVSMNERLVASISLAKVSHNAEPECKQVARSMGYVARRSVNHHDLRLHVHQHI